MKKDHNKLEKLKLAIAAIGHPYLFVLITLLSIASICSLYYIYTESEKLRKETREEYLLQNLQKAVIEFEEGIEQYAILVSSLRSHILGMGSLPDGNDVQTFIQNQLEFTEYGHSIVINYIDSNHTFLWSISEKELTPNNFIGTNVLDIRDTATIHRMDFLLRSKGLVLFPPINLYEGFIGFPMDFRVVVDNKVIGYIAALIDMKNILDPIIEKDLKKEFTYRFSYGNEVLFDRERVFNGTEIHHSRVDSNNLQLDKSQYLLANSQLYNMSFNIGISFRNENHNNQLSTFTKAGLTVILLFILISSVLIILFLRHLYRKNIALHEALEKEKELSQLKSQFVSMASHEFRTPLTTINFAAGSIKKYWYKLDADARNKKLDTIENQVKHLVSILSDLLMVGKTEAGIIRCHPQTVNFNAFIQPIIEEVVNNTGKTHEALLLNEDPDTSIRIDTKLGRNIFINLLTNAITFSPGKEKVVIKITTTSKIAQITVIDYGLGIEEKELEIIFDPFRRGTNAETIQGTGLGLHIVRELVTLHQGKIEVKSTPNKGSTFMVSIPNE